MGTPFMGEVKMIGWNFPPRYWAFCDGQTMQINQNQALFSILGTQFGGDGRTTFGLPDLRGRIPIHQGAGWLVGQNGGEISHTLTPPETPTHTHFAVADTATGVATPPANPRLAASSGQSLYGGFNNQVPMDPASISNVGGSQAHDNAQPYLTINFIIALQGVFPSRN